MSARAKKVTVLLIALCLCIVDILMIYPRLIIMVRNMWLSGIGDFVPFFLVPVLAFCAIGIFDENRQTGFLICTGGMMFISISELTRGIINRYRFVGSDIFNDYLRYGGWVIPILVGVMLLLVMNNNNRNMKMLFVYGAIGVLAYIIPVIVFAPLRNSSWVFQLNHFPLFILSVIYLRIKIKKSAKHSSAYPYLDEYKAGMSDTNYSLLTEYKRSANGANLSYLAEYKRTTK